MSRLRRLLTSVLALSAVACSDGITPTAFDGVALNLSIEAPAAVSQAEIDALAAAFDRIDSYSVTVRSTSTGSIVAEETVSVGSGTSHVLDVDVPLSAVGLSVLVELVAFDGELELYRASTTLVVEESTSPTPVVAAVRYTGPGIRGTIQDVEGVGLEAVEVQLLQGANLIATVPTEPDGTFLFLPTSSGGSVGLGLYQVQPAPTGLFVCPVARNVTVSDADDALVTDFLTQTAACDVDLLIVAGGDFDDTPQVEALFANTPGVNVASFFYVNQLPTLNTLRQYDAVLLFTNGIFDETVSLGNRLDEYVQAGGNMIFSSFYWQGRSDAQTGSPGWGALEGIDPFTSLVDQTTGVGGATYQTNALDPTSVVAHELTANVNTITSTSGFSAGVAAKPDATVLASWTDAGPLVGYRILAAGQRLAAVSLFPASGTGATGDVQALWENAVIWAGVAGGPAAN